MFRRRFFAILKKAEWYDPVLQDGNLYLQSINNVLQIEKDIWIDPKFGYEPPVQTDNVLNITEVIGVTAKDNVAEVI